MNTNSIFPSRSRFQAASLASTLLAVAVLIAVPLRAEDESPIPHARPISRYQEMKGKSPFALATPVQQAAEPQASFAANWFISGIGRLGSEDFVTIKARDLSNEFSLYGHDANPENGVILASIEWSEKIGKSAVVIKKGTETAKLEFNEAEMNGPPQVTTAASGGKTPSSSVFTRPLPGLQIQRLMLWRRRVGSQCRANRQAALLPSEGRIGAGFRLSMPLRILEECSCRLRRLGNSNFDMMTLQNGWPSSRGVDLDWHHSDAREVAYIYTYRLFDKFVEIRKLNQ